MKKLVEKVIKKLAQKALCNLEEELFNENGHARKFLQNLIKFCKNQLKNL